MINGEDLGSLKDYNVDYDKVELLEDVQSIMKR